MSAQISLRHAGVAKAMLVDETFARRQQRSTFMQRHAAQRERHASSFARAACCDAAAIRRHSVPAGALRQQRTRPVLAAK